MSEADRPARSADRLERSLDGKIALVTGGGVRLGRAHVKALAARGAHVAKRAGDRMLEGEGGVIVNIACAGGVRPWGDYAAYCVSKAGVVMLTQVLAKALAPKVRVNAIAPGPVLMPESYDETARERAI